MSYGQQPEDERRAEALDDLVDAMQATEMSWWRRAIALPCFLTLAGTQVVRRRWAELWGGW